MIVLVSEMLHAPFDCHPMFLLIFSPRGLPDARDRKSKDISVNNCADVAATAAPRVSNC